MGRGKVTITCLVGITLGLTPFSAPPSVTAASSRADCHEIGSLRSSLDEAFQDITHKYIRSAFFTDAPQSPHNPSEGEGTIDEIGAGTIILVITNQNQLAKLLAKVDGTDLLIQKFVTYGSGGGTVARGENLRLSDGGRLDLDRGTDNPPTAEADLRWKRERTMWRLEPANRARSKVLIVVPVIVHYMNSKDRRDSQNVQDEFLPRTLQELFAPTGTDGDMNTIWAQAGILFLLYQFEDCKYSLKDFSPKKQSRVSKKIPSPGDDCQCLFRRLNGVYNSPEVHGLDLYVWSNLDVYGYGAPHRKDGPSPGPGAIWVDSTCMAYRCGHLLAHEAGHFLLGCHICVTRGVTPPKERGRCGFCLDIPECSTEQGNHLMRDDAPRRPESQRLTPKEIQDARKKALDHRVLVTRAGPQ